MWRKIPDWLIYLVIVIALYANANRASQKIGPLPPPPELGPMLPNETPRDERIIVNVKRADSGIGTAFAIDGNGRWMTARHVVDSCAGSANPSPMTFIPNVKLENAAFSLGSPKDDQVKLSVRFWHVTA